MNYFRAQYYESIGTIAVETNTKWQAFVEGNVMLDKYNGYGDMAIYVIVPEIITYGTGNVFFKYGEGYCEEYSTIFVSLFNDEMLSVSPSEISLNGKGDMQVVKVSSSRAWTTSINTDKFKYFKSEDNIYIISNTDDNFNCGEDTDENFKLTVSTQSKSVDIVVFQCLETNGDSGCRFTVDKTKINDTSFLFTVSSFYNGNFDSFEYTIDSDLECTKLDYHRVLVKVINEEKMNWKITFSNSCSSITETIKLDNIETVSDAFYTDNGTGMYGYYNYTENNPLPLSITKENVNDSFSYYITSEDSNGNNVPWSIVDYDNTQLQVNKSDALLTFSVLENYTVGEGSITLVNSNGRSIVFEYELVEGLFDICYVFSASVDTSSITVSDFSVEPTEFNEIESTGISNFDVNVVSYENTYMENNFTVNLVSSDVNDNDAYWYISEEKYIKGSTKSGTGKASFLVNFSDSGLLSDEVTASLVLTQQKSGNRILISAVYEKIQETSVNSEEEPDTNIVPTNDSSYRLKEDGITITNIDKNQC